MCHCVWTRPPCVEGLVRKQCWRVLPRDPTPGGCLEFYKHNLSDPATAYDVMRTDGKRTAVVLERNGRLSQDLINAAVSVVLQERMGYEVIVVVRA